MEGAQQMLMPGQFLIDKGKVIDQGSPRQRGHRVIPEWIVHVAALEGWIAMEVDSTNLAQSTALFLLTIIALQGTN